MLKQKYIDPDHYLETPNGREWSVERGKEAWELAYAELEEALCSATTGSRLYLVCGLQGAGKSTWIRRNTTKVETNAVFFDAALPARQHRKRIIDLASNHHVPVVAVWLNVPLEIALQRNAERTADKQVPETTIRQVFSILEPPSETEGFVHVIEINK